MAEPIINPNIYKIYQLMEFFTNRYGFNNVLVKNYIVKNEVWLANENSKYSLIRISNSSLDQTYADQNRINEYIKAISNSIGRNVNFLDIHISNEEVSELEQFETVCIDSNFYSGVDINEYYPNIKNVVHDVDNPEGELANRINSVNNNLKTRFKEQQKKLSLKFKFNATSIIAIICLINFAIGLYLSKKFDSSISALLCGGDYKFFTFGMGEYWRLITHAFVHANFYHLFMNMYSFVVLGNYMERKIGTLKFVSVLFTSIIVGCLTHSALADNSLSVGLSGGLYGLFTLYVIDAIKAGAYKNRTFMFVILLNVSLNFMSGVAWQAHLGGAITGLLFYYMFKEDKTDYKMIPLIIIVIVALVYKTVTNDITPLYTGTDIAYVEALKNLGFTRTASNLYSKISSYLFSHLY